jgi:arylsulfatase A-like enzyme
MSCAPARRHLPVALFALALAACGVSTESRGAPNVVLITLESIRPEHLGCYGYDRPTSPALDALAAESVVYDDAHAVTSWTLASHASLFTGLYPTAHQAVGPVDVLGDDYETLAETLAAAGYATAGFASGPYLRRQHNLHQGFELYDDSFATAAHIQAHGEVTNPGITDAIVRYLRDGRDRQRPFLLFAYFWDPHYDYIPPPPNDTRFVPEGSVAVDVTEYGVTRKIHEGTPPEQMEYVLAQYDGEIRWTDEHLARIFDALREEGLWDDTVVIVTSDHGQEFFEHGAKGHKNNLFVESVRVPLLVKHAGNGPRGHDDRLVSLVDVFPTVVELAGASSEIPFHGVSLLDAEPPAGREIFFELLSIWYRTGNGRTTETRESWYAMRTHDHKLVSVPKRGKEMLFDVRNDPGERKNTAPQEAELAGSLSRRLTDWQADMKGVAELYRVGGEAALTPEQIERLKSLGYLGD